MKQIPNLFTLLNLVFGCMAITVVLEQGLVVTLDADWQRDVLIQPQKIWLASVFIFAAALVDFLDGFVARLFDASSEMGKQLDSLADVVSFGVAPSMILYHFLKLSWAQTASGLSTSIWLLVPAFLVAAAAAYRLARFNIDTQQTSSFLGVPTPAVGLLVASFPLIVHYETGWIMDCLYNRWILYILISVLVVSMNMRIPMLSFKFKNRTWRDLLPQGTLLIVAALSLIVFGWSGIPLIFIAYMLTSIIFKKQIS
jgi:CDP-diacylglycerol--serine O-phosphatidyltransferase